MFSETFSHLAGCSIIVSLMALYAMCKYASVFTWPVEKTPRMGNDSLRHCLPMLQFTHPLLDCIGLGEVGPSVDLCHDRAMFKCRYDEIGFIMVVIGSWMNLSSQCQQPELKVKE